MNIKTNDKIYIKHGDISIPFIGLEEALKEYNEENLNTIISNVLNLLDLSMFADYQMDNEFFLFFYSNNLSHLNS